MDWKTIPKIELHCHLDGSLRPELVRQLLEERGESRRLEELTEALRAPMDCGDLSEYLRRFDLPNQVLQRADELERAACDLARQAAEEQVRYLECRFAPTFSTAEGLKVQEVLAAVEKGFAAAREETGIETGILVCGMRGLSPEANLSMLKAAAEMKGCGVVGCDLAGDEKAYPMAEFVYFFEKAKEYGLPFTIHAGEQGSRQNIRGAIALGARRLGHGIAMMGDGALQGLCRDRGVAVELCPTSNIQTGAISAFSRYPFNEFLAAGLLVSINTDNRTVSGTDMTAEYRRLFEQFPQGPEVLEKIYRDSVEASFASDEVKDRLLASKS